MYDIFDKNNSYAWVPDPDFRIFNALFAILSNDMHRGTITVIEIEDDEEIRRDFFIYKDKKIGYDRSTNSDRQLEFIDEEEMLNVFQKVVRIYCCVGDPDEKADYYFVVDRYEDIDYDETIPQMQAALKLIREGKL